MLVTLALAMIATSFFTLKCYGSESIPEAAIPAYHPENAVFENLPCNLNYLYPIKFLIHDNELDVSSNDIEGVINELLLELNSEFNDHGIGFFDCGYEIGTHTEMVDLVDIYLPRFSVVHLVGNGHDGCPRLGLYNCGMRMGNMQIYIGIEGSCWEGVNNFSSTFHEYGHEFGLEHTFYPFTNEPNDCIGTLIDPPNGDDCENALGEIDENCNTYGDNCCDTPKDPKTTADYIVKPYHENTEVNLGMTLYNYDPENQCATTTNNCISPAEGIRGGCGSFRFATPINRELDPGWELGQLYHPSNMMDVEPCEYIANLVDDDLVEYNPSTNNIMSYTGVGCGVVFTDDQYDIIMGNQNGRNVIPYTIYLAVTDNPEEEYEFSNLSSAFNFIKTDRYVNYTILVDDDYSGIEDAELSIQTQIYRNLNIRIIGVSEYVIHGHNISFIEHKVQHVTISRHEIDSNPIIVYDNINLELYNLKFMRFSDSRIITNFTSRALALDFMGGNLKIDNCVFVDNGNSCGLFDSIVRCDGVVRFAPSANPSLIIENSLFVNNVSPGGRSVALTMTEFGGNTPESCAIIKSTFANNGYTNSATDIGAMHIQVSGQTEVLNTIFSGSDSNHGVPGNQQPIAVEYGLPTNMLAIIDYCLFDQDEWLQTNLQELNSTNVVISSSDDVGFVDSESGDYRLRWNSVCLEKGDPNVLDFDETRSDIGWSPDYPEVEISGTVEIDNPGHYLVTATTTVHSGNDVVIPDGTVLKMDGAYNLFIKDSNPANGFNITVGDPNGARTSFVGSESYLSINIGDYAIGAPIADCSFNGVLFNKLSPDNSSRILRFSNCNVSLDGTNGNIAFNDSKNIEVYFAEICRGDFKNFDFELPQIHEGEKGIGWLTIANSDIDLINVNFDAVPGARPGDNYPWFWKALHTGTVPGNSEHIIRDCVFPSQDNQYLAIPLYTSGAEFNLHHNQFTGVEVGAISASVATLNMNNGAMNSFIKTPNQVYLGYSIIAGVQAPMDLYCGYNTFVYPTLDPGDMFVEDACATTDWRNNFWGSSCSFPVDPTGHIPACVSNVQPTLSTCPDTFSPCDTQTGDGSTLYSLGANADAIQNYEAACGYWAQLLLDFPDSKYGTSVAGSIKAIGLLTEYGASDYGQIRLDLEAAAAVTEPTNFLLSVFQQCSALCVEARHGDRTAALALLDALLVEVTGNKDAVFLVNAAIAEIGLWEEEGGLSAAGPEMDQARFVRQMQKLRAYQQALLPMGNMERASSEAPGQEATVQAATFQLHGSYPNPFNPVTTIDLDCLGDVPLLLEIYNLAGQRVDVLHQGEIAAGRHLFQWNPEKMASGLYLARAEQGSHTATHKLILLH